MIHNLASVDGIGAGYLALNYVASVALSKQRPIKVFGIDFRTEKKPETTFGSNEKSGSGDLKVDFKNLATTAFSALNERLQDW